MRASCNGTLLHTRRYLSYHESRFTDRSLVIEDAMGHMRAVLPAADEPGEAGVVTSHPGVTYGGVVHDGTLQGEPMVIAVEAAVAHFKDAGDRVLRYRPAPFIYWRTPAGDDLYALSRVGARRPLCRLSTTVDLATRRPVTENRRRMRKTAERSGVTVAWGWEHREALWSLLEDRLVSRYGRRPVHTLDEMMLLRDRFPGEILMVAALCRGDPVAGGVLYCAPPTMHLQYAIAGDTAHRLGGMDVVIEEAIARAGKDGYRYFDHGVSTFGEDCSLNTSLHHYKVSFGGGGTVYEQYDVDLS